jgi:Resolvase, N terminal domain
MRLVIYARVSTKDQSCDLQLRDLRAYCAARGFSLIGECIDIGESGAKDSRPQLNEVRLSGLGSDGFSRLDGNTHRHDCGVSAAYV